MLGAYTHAGVDFTHMSPYIESLDVSCTGGWSSESDHLLTKGILRIRFDQWRLLTEEMGSTDHADEGSLSGSIRTEHAEAFPSRQSKR